jgi:hypothetical protein
MVTLLPLEVPRITPKLDGLVERLGEDVVRQRDVVVRPPDAQRLVDGPAERAVVDHDVAHRLGGGAFDLERVAVGRVRSHRIVTRANAQVLDQHVGGLDLDRRAANRDAG